MKKVISYYKDFSPMYFAKENFLKPHLLAKALNCKCEIYYGENSGKEPLPEYVEETHLICQDYRGEAYSQFFKVLWLIIKEARNISVLMTFHISGNILVLATFLKLLNSKAKIWVSGDIEAPRTYNGFSSYFENRNGVKGKIMQFLYHRLFNNIDAYTVETTQCYDILSPLFNRLSLQNLLYFPCAVDEGSVGAFDKTNTEEKENLIISVSRFGPYQKNSEMLLEGLSKTNLNNWKVKLIGPITSDFSLNNNPIFQSYIDKFFENNPYLRDKIEFTGPIFDKEKLNDYFRRAKIFIMTSRHEAFANVFAQARWYRCHIVSTDVGGAKDMSLNWKYGTMIRQEDPCDMANKMNLLLHSNISFPDNDFAKSITYQRIMEDILIPRLFPN